MPAGSDPVRLPHTWRPMGVRIVATIAYWSMVVLALVVWMALGADVRRDFTGFQQGTLVVLGAAVGAVWWGLMRCRLTAREDTVEVVNGYRAHRYEWAEVVAMRLRDGAPWAELDLADGTSMMVLGLQTSDGIRMRQGVGEFRALLEAHSRTERND